jgi:hypothetical protein
MSALTLRNSDADYQPSAPVSAAQQHLAGQRKSAPSQFQFRAPLKVMEEPEFPHQDSGKSSSALRLNAALRAGIMP